MTAATILRPLPWGFSDGGRRHAGFTGRQDAGDCVARAIAIAVDLPYRDVYDRLAAGMAALGLPRSARNGVSPKVYRPLIEREMGWTWTPTMAVGAGCTTHLAEGEIPSAGRLIVRLSRHLAAVVDGTVFDLDDPSRGGTRCVYGWWQEPAR